MNVESLRERLKESFSAAGPQLARALLRIQVRFDRAPEDVPFGGKFDPSACLVADHHLTILHAGEPAYRSRIEILGAFDGELWTWPWNEDSTSSDDYASVRSVCDRTLELAELSKLSRLECDESFAAQLAALIATRMEWHGAFDIALDDGRVRFVALRELGPKDERVYCAWCFGNALDHVINIQPFSEDLGVCNVRASLGADLVQEIADERELSLEAYLASPTPPAGGFLDQFPCVSCGRRDHLVMGAHAALCGICIVAAKRHFDALDDD